MTRPDTDPSRIDAATPGAIDHARRCRTVHADRAPGLIPDALRTTILITLLLSSTVSMAQTQALLLDDFSSADGVSTLGTRWQGFTDRVMGGLSEMKTAYVDTEKGKALRMSGPVRLENNGGFIQVRLPLGSDGETLDAGRFDAVAVTLRGEPGAYFVHLRTPDARRPWQYYRAEIAVSTRWARQVIALSQFEGKSISRPLDTGRLSSIAIVAYGQTFDALVEINRLELVSDPGQRHSADP